MSYFKFMDSQRRSRRRWPRWYFAYQIKIHISSYLLDEHVLLQKFDDATTQDEQIVVLKKIVNLNKKKFDNKLIKCLAILFLEAEELHPVKLFIIRYVTQFQKIQEPFTSMLASVISEKIATKTTSFKDDLQIIKKVVTCIDNFDAGVAAIKIVESDLATYLQKCLHLEAYKVMCFSINENPLPFKEDDNICNILYLLLHIIQTANNENLEKFKPMYATIRNDLKTIMLDQISMDTKALCGILFMFLYIASYGPDSFLHVLNPTRRNELSCLLWIQSSEICLYSAILKVVPIETLETVKIKDTVAIRRVLSTMVDISKRSFDWVKLFIAESIYDFCSSGLEKITHAGTGEQITDFLTQYAQCNLDDSSLEKEAIRTLRHLFNYRYDVLERKHFSMPAKPSFNSPRLTVYIVEEEDENLDEY